MAFSKVMQRLANVSILSDKIVMTESFVESLAGKKDVKTNPTKSVVRQEKITNLIFCICINDEIKKLNVSACVF